MFYSVLPNIWRQLCHYSNISAAITYKVNIRHLQCKLNADNVYFNDIFQFLFEQKCDDIVIMVLPMLSILA